MSTVTPLLLNITPQLIKSARIFLGWTQKDLAKRLEISIPTLISLESSNNNSSISPSRNFQIIRVFLEEGVEFIDDKGFIQNKTSYTVNYKGQEGLRVFFEKMYNKVLHSDITYIDVIGLDETKFMETFQAAQTHVARMIKLKEKFKMRVIINDSPQKNLQSYCEYRWLNNKYFTSLPIYIIDENTVAFLCWEPLEVIYMENSAIGISFKKLFNYVWNFNPSQHNHED